MKIHELKTKIKYEEEISKYLKNYNNEEYFKYYINGFLLNDGHLYVYSMQNIVGIRLKYKRYFVSNSNKFLTINFKEILKYKKIDINGNQINNFRFILFYYVFKIKCFFYRNYINFKMFLNEKFE